jgi:8-oxo-dGTP pyrophosphatase MutT (NUDIX family)
VTDDSLLDLVARLPFAVPGDPAGVPASVLLALSPVDGADDLALVLVQRPDFLRQHAGQVGLPGGSVEPGDADGVAAALREAEEEVGLDPARVRVVGSLDRAYLAVSNYDVLPVVGVWDGKAELRPDPVEVAGILRPTLRQLADPANHGVLPFSQILGRAAAARRGDRPPDASGPVFWVDGVLVWGFTAALLAGFLHSVGLTAPPVPDWWGGRPDSLQEPSP